LIQILDKFIKIVVYSVKFPSTNSLYLFFSLNQNFHILRWGGGKAQSISFYVYGSCRSIYGKRRAVRIKRTQTIVIRRRCNFFSSCTYTRHIIWTVYRHEFFHGLFNLYYYIFLRRMWYTKRIIVYTCIILIYRNISRERRIV